jgi:hypothetical protein
LVIGLHNGLGVNASIATMNGDETVSQLFVKELRVRALMICALCIAGIWIAIARQSSKLAKF